MLSRYKMYRGRRPDDDPLPDGLRQDTRKHTRHFLRPTADLVSAYLKRPNDASWRAFSSAYLDVLESRFGADPNPFDQLADRAMQHDVFLGCSCPTAANPDPRRCHTVLALQFMKNHYSKLKVIIPQ